MSLNIEKSQEVISSNEKKELNVYEVIERLKIQKALPPNVFGNDFDSSSPIQPHIKLLFQNVTDMNFYTVFKTIITLPDDNNNELVQKRLSGMQIMSFAQIIFYKVFPCPEKDCTNCPRDVVIKNQYKDYEYECPFYHDEKDKRRLILTPNINEEFTYKANYFDEKKHAASDKEKCSQNYFESMFHPLYYKMFKCKREHCNFSLCCPFYHSEEEKKAWDRTFGNFIRKDRISYVKEKQKYFEAKSNNNIPINANTNNKNMRFAPKQANSDNRILRASLRPSESTNDSTNHETSSPLSGLSYGSQKQSYKQTKKFEPILTQPMQSENSAEKRFKSGYFKEKEDWTQSEKKIYVKRIGESEAETPSTTTSGGQETAWRIAKKPLC